MNELITTFHIDWKMIIAQLLNFAIVLFVLYKFAYGPVIKIMNDRTKKIDKGLKDAEETQKKFIEMTQKEQAVIIEAKKQAHEIIAEAEVIATKNREEMMAETKVQTEKILQDAQKKIEAEKSKMFAEVKAEIAELVVAAAGKIIDEKIDISKDADLIAKAIK
jgi:F-type H+-transporting ATPase subunit b